MIPAITPLDGVQEVDSRYYGPKSAPITTKPINTGTIYYFPVFVRKARNFASIVAIFGGSWGQTMRLALYADNGGVPGALLVESGAIPTAATFEYVINRAIGRGVVWIAAQISISHASASQVANYEYMGANASGQQIFSYTQAQAYGAFPATATPVASAAVEGALVALKTS